MIGKTVVHSLYATVVPALLCANMTSVVAQDIVDDHEFPFTCLDKGNTMSIRNDRGDNTSGDWSYTRDQLTSYGPVPEVKGPGSAPPAIRPTDRIGWSSDGTNDEDDWAAVPVVWATAAKAGWYDQFVHLDYNDRLSDKDLPKEREMRKSSIEGALQFRFNKTKIFDGLDAVQLEACIQHLVEQINMSSADSKFYYIQAGTFEVAYRALERAMPSKRKYCVLVSHSEMNEWEQKWQIKDMSAGEITNSVGTWARGMVDCVNPVTPSGDPDKPTGLGASFYFTSKMGYNSRPLRPQFGNKNYRDGWRLVEWMSMPDAHPAYQWVHARFKTAMLAKSGVDAGLDASDGGMFFAMAKGEYNFGTAGGFAALDTFLGRSLTLPGHPTPVVTRLELINMNNNAVVRVISDGDVIDPATLPNNVTIRAITNPVTIDSVTFRNDGVQLLKDEVGSLYTINEDSDGRIQAWNYSEGNYNLSVMPKLGSRTGSTYSVSFTIGEGGGGVNTPAFVNITSPSVDDEIYASTDVLVDVEAGDNSGIVRVWMNVDGTWVDSSTEATSQFNLGALTEGSHTLLVRAVAGDGERVDTEITIQVVNAVGPIDPTLSTSAGPNASGELVVTAVAEDDNGIDEVLLWIKPIDPNESWVAKGAGTLSEGNYVWNLGTISAGDYYIITKAFSQDGGIATNTITTTIEEGGGPVDPTLSTSAVPNASGELVVTAVADDDSGIKRVALWIRPIGGTWVWKKNGKLTGGDFVWNLGILSAGDYQIRTKAFSNDGATVIDTITVTIDS